MAHLHIHGFCVPSPTITTVTTTTSTTRTLRSAPSNQSIPNTIKDNGTKPTSNDANRRKEVNVYMLTFPNLYPTTTTTTRTSIKNDKTSNYKNKYLTTYLKNWKYYILGDGGVYFDQRPKTLIKLNQLILDEIIQSYNNNHEYDKTKTSNNKNVQVECAVISTCKRFEILITIESNHKKDKECTSAVINTTRKRTFRQEKDEREFIKSIIVSFITKQILCHRYKLRLQSWIPLLTLLVLPLDRPSRLQSINRRTREVIERSISTRTTSTGGNSRGRIIHQYDELKQSLDNEINIIHGRYDVTNRLIHLASGLLDRPKFRPFSSRDSHIMSQLKRTLDASQRCSFTLPLGVSRNTNMDEIHLPSKSVVYNNSKYTKILLDSALQGGKAARSPKVVPILDQLRDESNGADGPIKLSARAAEDAKLLALAPTLHSCLERIKAMEASDLIASLYDDARDIANGRGIDMDKDEGKSIRQMLHKPATDLRLGNVVDVGKILDDIDRNLQLS